MSVDPVGDESYSARPDLTLEQCRIAIGRRTARWTDDDVTASDAMDFWAFAAGAANVVMQLARPQVGYGVVESRVESGNLLVHPWKRARTTFQYLAVALLGSDDDRVAFKAAVDGVHREVTSTTASPVRYSAFDRKLQMWVAACLFVGLEDTYQLLRGVMTPEQSEQFYLSAWPLGTTLQVTDDQWPATRAQFDDYWVDACRRVTVDAVVQTYLQDLLNLGMINPVLRLSMRPLLKFLTAGFLAPVFRDALGLGWGSGRQFVFERLFLTVAFANRFLPEFVRQGGSLLLLADVRRRIRTHRRLV